ncbi:unnamed protein product [Taenia asiatica]|uniref:Uncharacterized protein n=1 Tax=Taenia asiatica TaxID=60517 RepID=A0A0R3W9C7_TAEAS|nr:unnamed protein product [Taenia asiatica]
MEDVDIQGGSPVGLPFSPITNPFAVLVVGGGNMSPPKICSNASVDVEGAVGAAEAEAEAEERAKFIDSDAA